MNNFINEHRDRLSNYLIVFGMGGFLIYGILLVTGFLLKYGMQIVAVLKGMGI